MSTLIDALKTTNVSDLAIPSNVTYGTAMFKRGGVEILTQNDNQVEARAGGLDGSSREGGGSRRKVQLWVEDGELRWHCNGNPKDHDIFCKHCVAVSLHVTA